MGLPVEGTWALCLGGGAFDHRRDCHYIACREAQGHERDRALEGQRWGSRRGRDTGMEAEKGSGALTVVKGFTLKAVGTEGCSRQETQLEPRLEAENEPRRRKARDDQTRPRVGP